MVPAFPSFVSLNSRKVAVTFQSFAVEAHWHAYKFLHWCLLTRQTKASRAGLPRNLILQFLNKVRSKNPNQGWALCSVHYKMCLGSPSSSSESSSMHFMDVWQAMNGAIFRANPFSYESAVGAGATTSRSRCVTWHYPVTMLSCFRMLLEIGVVDPYFAAANFAPSLFFISFASRDPVWKKKWHSIVSFSLWNMLLLAHCIGIWKLPFNFAYHF